MNKMSLLIFATDAATSSEWALKGNKIREGLLYKYFMGVQSGHQLDPAERASTKFNTWDKTPKT